MLSWEDGKDQNGYLGEGRRREERCKLMGKSFEVDFATKKDLIAMQ